MARSTAVRRSKHSGESTLDRIVYGALVSVIVLWLMWGWVVGVSALAVMMGLGALAFAGWRRRDHAEFRAEEQRRGAEEEQRRESYRQRRDQL